MRAVRAVIALFECCQIDFEQIFLIGRHQTRKCLEKGVKIHHITEPGISASHFKNEKFERLSELTPPQLFGASISAMGDDGEVYRARKDSTPGTVIIEQIY